MADLARIEKPITARRRGSDNRDFTLPGRRETDTPRLEINAPIAGRSQSEARELSAILGLAEDAGQEAVGLLEQGAARRRDQDRADASLAFASGEVDDERLANSRAYAQGYYLSGAQRTVIELSRKAEQAVNERLFNEDDPATLEDVNETLNSLFSSYALNEDGSPRNFGDPLAARVMAEGLSRIRAEVLPKAVEFIRTRQNEQLAANQAFVLVNGGMPEIFSGAPETPIGSLRVPQAGDVQAVDVAPSAAAPPVQVTTDGGVPMAATGRMPVRGTTTSSFTAHRRRGSAGLDIAAPIGTAVELPASGEVIEVDRVGRGASGKFIRVRHSNGAVSSYSHLSNIDVAEGQALAAGHRIGAVGNTGRVRSANGGDGAHLHYRIKVDGKDVDPATYTFDGVVAMAAPEGANEDPNLRDRLAQPAPEVAPRVVDFEAVMAKRPPSISPGEWKAYMVPAIILQAEEAGQPEILDGLWRSTRPDGTPSFNPTEIGQIRDAADRIRDERRTEARRIQNERHEQNGDLIITEILNGRDPSDETLIGMANGGDLEPSFVYSIIEHREVEREQAVREANADAREANTLAEQEFDRELATTLFEREAGVLGGASREDDLARLNRGEFGSGKNALRRFRQARAAAEAGVRRVEESPAGQRYSTMLDERFPRVSPTTTGGSMLERTMGRASNVNRAAAFSHYSALLAEGKTPREAYESAVRTYGGETSEAELRRRQRDLQSRR